MAKLYIFGIGGTGSRVLRSFTMLMAAGVKLGKSINEIVPIIIDPDQANADLTRAVDLIGKYRNIRKELTFTGKNPNRFFCPDIVNVQQLQIKGTDDKTLKQFIDLPSMDKSSEAMIRMLFSEKNLNSSMNVGFKGNPNIGSVVLNQIVDTDEFGDFANSFQEGDMIFIISSIFGGTGASGFPLLLKTLRTGQSFNGHALINKAAIGAVTVLPYFKIKTDDNSEIESSTFISKTKSALAYYEKNIVNNNSLNALYYLADEASNTYDNHEGGGSQQNDAHMIEFLAATAIIDFTYNPNIDDDGNIKTSNREFGITADNKVVTFGMFGNEDKQRLYGPMTQFMLLSLCMTNKYDYFSSEELDANMKYFMNITHFMSTVSDFCKKYKEWLNEMKRNKRSLGLFTFDDHKVPEDPFNVVTDVKKSKGVFIFKSGYSLVADSLNRNVSKCISEKAEDKWMEMYYRGTEKLFKDKLEKAI